MNVKLYCLFPPKMPDYLIYSDDYILILFLSVILFMYSLTEFFLPE